MKIAHTEKKRQINYIQAAFGRLFLWENDDMIEILIGLCVGGTIGVLAMWSGRASAEQTGNPLAPLVDEMLTTLRFNLLLLREELKNRRFSGVPEYITPVQTAVERTRNAIALAERWAE